MSKTERWTFSPNRESRLSWFAHLRLFEFYHRAHLSEEAGLRSLSLPLLAKRLMEISDLVHSDFPVLAVGALRSRRLEGFSYKALGPPPKN